MKNKRQQEVLKTYHLRPYDRFWFISIWRMYAQEKIKPYNQQEEKGAQVERMFDSIANTYDRLNHLLSLGIDRRWRKTTINSLKPFAPDCILDIATGTGDFAILEAKLLKPTSIIGADLSEGMMNIARQKTIQAGLDQIISFKKEDCTNLTFSDHTFDAVTVAYGVRNYKDLDKGLKEMLRVLKPGGHLAILELCTPKSFPMRQLFWLYSHIVMPAMGRLLSKDGHAYKYLPATMEAFPQGETMKLILEKAGYENVSFKRFTFGLCTMYLASSPQANNDKP